MFLRKFAAVSEYLPAERIHFEQDQGLVIGVYDLEG